MLIYLPNENLSPGIHELSFGAFFQEYGLNKRRKDLITGLLKAAAALKDCGCSILYVDGSFVSKKIDPGDYDACYDPSGMDFAKMFKKYPVFFDNSPGRKNLKLVYGGELFSTTALAAPPRSFFLEFFQRDRDGWPKGIIKLNLKELP